MSEAVPETEKVEEEDEQDETPSLSKQAEELFETVGADELLEIEEPDDVEAEAIKRVEIRADYDAELDELDDTQDAHDELDRLYNDEELSLANIGRLYRSTDATIQRRMEQHGLPRRGNRAELSKEQLIDEAQCLAVEINNADDFEHFRDLADAGEAETVTTTKMTDEGRHSAHTYYNYFDSWSDIQDAANLNVAEVEVEDEDDDDE